MASGARRRRIGRGHRQARGCRGGRSSPSSMTLGGSATFAAGEACAGGGLADATGALGSAVASAQAWHRSQVPVAWEVSAVVSGAASWQPMPARSTTSWTGGDTGAAACFSCGAASAEDRADEAMPDGSSRAVIPATSIPWNRMHSTSRTARGPRWKQRIRKAYTSGAGVRRLGLGSGVTPPGAREPTATDGLSRAGRLRRAPRPLATPFFERTRPC